MLGCVNATRRCWNWTMKNLKPQALIASLFVVGVIVCEWFVLASLHDADTFTEHVLLTMAVSVPVSLLTGALFGWLLGTMTVVKDSAESNKRIENRLKAIEERARDA